MALADEIATDIQSSDFEDDLFVDVLWGSFSVKAIPAITGVEENMDDPGGVVLSDQREFKFRRTEIDGISSDLSMFGTKITYNGRTYDVDDVDERPGWPLLVVTATLRR